MSGIEALMDVCANEPCTAFLAPDGQVDALLALNHSPVLGVFDRLVVVVGEATQNPFAQNTWLNPRIAQFNSINEAQALLRQLQRSWFPYLHCEFRRGALIQERLPKVHAKPYAFLEAIPKSPLGSYTLLDRHHLFYSPSCSSVLPNGEVGFLEDREGPPSRAYLKLWELFTVFCNRPPAGAHCLEIGAAPGGWSHVLAELGCRLTTVDRADLTPALMANPRIEHHRGDAFRYGPDEVGSIDWLFSDIICYPDKLFTYVEAWLKSGKCRNFVCTLKFQGEEHYAAIERFRSIAGSRLVHLSHNKHELTWFLIRDEHG